MPDQDLEPPGVDLFVPIQGSWSSTDDGRFVVQTESKLQVVDLTRYALGTYESEFGCLEGSPSWPADGEGIVFTAEGPEGRNLYVWRLGAYEVAQLTGDEADDFMPAW